MTEQFFSSCPRGLEQLLVDELTELGASDVTAGDSGVSFRGDFTVCYRVNLNSRIAGRVLWQVEKAPYRNEDEVYKAALALPWADWFDVSNTIAVSVNARKCPLKSLEFITLRIKDAVCDHFRSRVGSRPNVDTREPNVRIFAFLEEATATFYVDTSGEALFKRGQRPASVDAPLKENLAAGILRMTGWKPGQPLLDPMCGGGTFLIEAAQISLDMAPGLGRRFGFERLRGFQADTWKTLKDEAEARRQAPRRLPIFGSDMYGNELKMARINAAHLGLEEAIEFKQVNVLEVNPPTSEGVWIVNPPYGVRIGEQEELANLYPKLGDVLKQRFAGWIAYFFTADLRLAKLIRLQASKRTPLYNGALECRLFEYRMVPGSARKTKSEGAS